MVAVAQGVRSCSPQIWEVRRGEGVSPVDDSYIEELAEALCAILGLSI